MPKLIDLSGMQLKNIKVISRAENQYSPKGQQSTMWECSCVCGNICLISSKSMNKNENVSCGCMNHKATLRRPELQIGQRFNRLVVTSLEYLKENRRYVDTLCDCGTEHSVRVDSLGPGKTESCGCLQKEKLSKSIITHGESATSLYKNYHAILQRCYNIESDNYENYGGRGIKVCERWLDTEKGYINFKEDMGSKPSKNFSIERKDVNGDYCPENCVWESSSVQGFNRRKLKLNTSGRTGVYWYKKRERYVVKIMKDGKEHWFGQYKEFEAACDAAEKGEIKLFGFSRTEYCL